MPHCRLVALNCRYTHSCAALFFVRAALERHLPEAATELLQLTINDPYYPTLLRVAEGDPDILLFSAYIWNSDYLARLLGDLARLRPGRPLVVGGPQAEFLGPLPKECTLVGGPVEGLPAGFFTDLGRGTVQRQYHGDPTAPFPFPYRDEDFSTQLAHRQILYESSRGCPFSCSYCLSATTTRVVRRPLEEVYRDLSRLLAHGPPLVKFVDRTFNDHPERALAIWRFLAEQDTATRFHFEIAPDLFSEEMLGFLATVPVGRFQFEIGIQSTSGEVLTAVRRKMDVPRALENIARLAEPGNIHLHADLILGLPRDTPTRFADSLRQVFAARPHHIQMGLLKLLPGTPIAAEAGRYGLRHCARPPHEALATATMDTGELAELYQLGECVERFHNTRFFPSLFACLAENGEDIFTFFQGLLHLCRSRDALHRAPTQELLTALMTEYLRIRDDAPLLIELLRHDWLRCGHRFLPACLADEPLAELRTRLRRTMPEDLPPLYDSRSRNRFFKQGIFSIFSRDALARVGFQAGEKGILCFHSTREPGLHDLRATTLLPGSVKDALKN